MKIKVKYSREKETDNYLNSLYKFRWLKHGRKDIRERLLKPLPSEFKKKLLNAKHDKEAEKIIGSYLKEKEDQRKDTYKRVAQQLQVAWNDNEKHILANLEKLYENKVPFDKIDVYLSSIPICPYNYRDKWIMVFANTETDRQIKIIIHELNHFMFYHYFGFMREKLDREKFESIKEALTVFTNPEEKGYPAQQTLRNWLRKQKGSIPEILSKPGWKKYL
jgi:hypothetical protein